MHRPRHRGFTLIELLIVIVVAGILAMVAIPGYQSAMQKSRRADARVAINQMAQHLERCYTQYGAYDADDCAIDAPFDSPEGHYSVSVVRDATTYMLTAEPQGVQADDSACGSLGMNSEGVHSATGDNPDKCW